MPAKPRVRKPIRVFYSLLSRRFFASSTYREMGDGTVVITGQKDDVTNEIAGLIEEHEVTFVKREPEGADRAPIAEEPAKGATSLQVPVPASVRARDGLIVLEFEDNEANRAMARRAEVAIASWMSYYPSEVPASAEGAP